MLIDFMDRAITQLREQESRDMEDEDTFLAANLENLLEEIAGDEHEVKKAIRHYSEVVAATNQKAGGREAVELGEVDNVILEEAARSNPLDLLVPMARAHSKIIMVGDHKQLPHLLEKTIADEVAGAMAEKHNQSETKDKLGESLFEVIFNNLEKSVKTRRVTLTTQFRMHEHIRKFISRTYYDGKLESHESVTDESKAHGLSIPWAKDKVTVFCDEPNVKEQKPVNSNSWTRPLEAERVIAILKELLADPQFQKENGLSVGIITFYAGQRDLLTKKCLKEGFIEQSEDGEYRTSSRYFGGSKERFRVGSVDAFQGKEFDVVILSTVRSNDKDRTDLTNEKKAMGTFGFLMLENRLNVAFSRAKSLIVTVGDLRMFTDDFAKLHVRGLHEFATVAAKDEHYGNILR